MGDLALTLSPRQHNHAVMQALIAEGCPPLLAPLYAARGITEWAQVHPSLAKLLPPDGLKNASVAAQCLAHAIINQQRLCVVADYDCDGATACAVAVLGLKLLGAKHVDFLVPNRFKNGYGLTPEVVEQVAIHPRLGKPDWIITVDNGISSVEGVDAANQLGIQVLVTDHHLSGTKFDDGSLPKAAAILNPNQPGCTFASKHIAGVGVMFYALLLVRSQLRQLGVLTEKTQPRLDTLLDLVAIGTVADVVRLDENNRALVAAGLDRIRQGAINGTLRPGVAALFAVAAKDAAQATTADIGFAIGPRINAAGRLDDMSVGIMCLMTQSPEQALDLANALQTMNLARRELEGDMQASAQQQAEQALSILQAQGNNLASGLVLYDATWHQGVVGLVASRIKETYWRPTIAFAPADPADETCELLRGSGRSIPGVHLRDALDAVAKQHPRLIHKFGGHAMAAGLTIASIDLDWFQTAFSAICTQLLSPEILAKILLTDTAPKPHEMTVQNVAALEAAVWGQGFEPPLFENTAVLLEQRVLKGAHLKLKLDIKGLSQPLDAIWFGRSHLLLNERIRAGNNNSDINNDINNNINNNINYNNINYNYEGSRNHGQLILLRIAYRLNINEYRGNRTVQALIEYAEVC